MQNLCSSVVDESVSGEFSNFRDLTCMLEKLPMTFDHSPKQRGDFKSTLHRRQHGDIIFNSMSVDPCLSVRQVEDTPRGGEAYLCMGSQLGGTQIFTQNDKRLTVNQGDIFFWRADHSCMSDSLTPLFGKAIMMPRDMVERRIGDISALAGEQFFCGVELTRVLSSHFHMLHDCVDGMSASARMAATLGLFEFALLSLTEREMPVLHVDELYRRILHAVQQNVEEDIGVSEVAAACNISVRKLQRVLAEHRETFGSVLKRERLKSSSRLLVSLADRHLSVTEIAYKFRFCDAAHFSRSFKNAFGVSPKEYRMRKAN